MTVDEMLALARQRLQRLEPHEADDAVRRGSVLIDVRTSEQRERDGTVPGAVPIALNVLEWRADPRSSAHDRRLGRADVPLIVLCAEGYCSSLAASRLIVLGRDATDVKGGFTAWRGNGLPVVGPTVCQDQPPQREKPRRERHVRSGDPGQSEGFGGTSPAVGDVEPPAQADRAGVPRRYRRGDR